MMRTPWNLKPFREYRLHLRGVEGQALLEFVLVLPILIIIFMGLVQIGTMRDTQILLNMAVRQGARVAALGGDGKKAMDSFLAEHPSIDKEHLTTRIERRFLHVRAVASYEVDVPQPLRETRRDPYVVKAECTMLKFNSIWDLFSFFKNPIL